MSFYALSRFQQINPANAIDQLLRRICNQLKTNELPVKLNNDEQRLLSQLTDITVVGSETCIDDLHTSILTILNRIQDWQNNIHCYQPLEYTMQSLRWLYDDKQFPEAYNWPDEENAQLDRIGTYAHTDET